MMTRAAQHYNRGRNDRNEQMARDPYRINNHMGIGRYQGKTPPEHLSQAEITGILDDLENNQTRYLLDRMGQVRASDRVLDAGCGRGGPAFTLYERSGCSIDGVTVSDYQLSRALDFARRRGIEHRVRFHYMSYVDLRFADGAFDHVFSNETTMHAFLLDELFAELNRVLCKGGRYTLATFAANEDFPDSKYIDEINDHYDCFVHTRREYVSALERQGFEIVVFDDVTELAIPYWEIRSLWEKRSGIEKAFLEGHRTRELLYLLISSIKK
jgi:geranyl diphosphate 2-C-methyltransferase